jgi:hypothetical protein
LSTIDNILFIVSCQEKNHGISFGFILFTLKEPWDPRIIFPQEEGGLKKKKPPKGDRLFWRSNPEQENGFQLAEAG